MLGEMTLESGTPIVRAESVGYIPQEAWIQNKTFKENVLFAKAFDATHYNKTLDACALRPDLELFAAGDQTEIGEKVLQLGKIYCNSTKLAQSYSNFIDCRRYCNFAKIGEKVP